jgi:hypothetical protein
MQPNMGLSLAGYTLLTFRYQFHNVTHEGEKNGSRGACELAFYYTGCD